MHRLGSHEHRHVDPDPVPPYAFLHGLSGGFMRSFEIHRLHRLSGFGIRHAIVVITLAMFAACVHAGGGPLGIDHEWALDESGIWARNV